MSIGALKKSLEEAKAAYLAEPSREAHELVKLCQSEISKLITEGANPCPRCGAAPIGLEQPNGKGTEYEVGCLGCAPFKHTDGTTRRPAVRGGVLPKHTVEAWNAGPDYWLKA